MSTPDSDKAPPVRRTPVDIKDPVPVAYLVPEEPSKSDDKSDDGAADSGAGAGNDVVEQIASVTDEAMGDVANQKPQLERHGSPFRESPDIATNAVTMPDYPDNVLRENLTIASVVVGIMSLITCAITSWAIIPGAVGLALGILGFKSDKKLLAAIGVILATLAISIGTWKTILMVQSYYSSQYEEMMNEAMDEAY